MTQRIGVRELCEKLSVYLEASEPIEVTRHGQTIGFFIPIATHPGQAEREALLEAGRRLDEEMARLGLNEDEIVEDFKHWQRGKLSDVLLQPDLAGDALDISRSRDTGRDIEL